MKILLKPLQRQEISRWYIDEPPDFGGKDEGATPIEYILAALSGCLNVMGHFIAREMGFELKGLRIELEGYLDPARLMGQTDKKRAGLESIQVKMIPDADVDPDVLKDWMMRVEDRCPVTDNLLCPTPISFKLK